MRLNHPLNFPEISESAKYCRSVSQRVIVKSTHTDTAHAINALDGKARNGSHLNKSRLRAMHCQVFRNYH